MRQFARFAMDQARRRISAEVKRKDLFYHLVGNHTFRVV